MNDPFVTMLLVWFVSSSSTGLALWFDRRRLGPVGRQRMWRDTTLWAAVSGVFVPPPLAFGAHIWVTRTWHWAVRLVAALLSSAALLVVIEVVCQMVQQLLAWTR